MRASPLDGDLLELGVLNVNELLRDPRPNKNKDVDDTRGLGPRDALDIGDKNGLAGVKAGTWAGIAIRKPRPEKGLELSSVEDFVGELFGEYLCMAEKDDCRVRGVVITEPKVGAGLMGRDDALSMPAVQDDHPCLDGVESAEGCVASSLVANS